MLLPDGIGTFQQDRIPGRPSATSSAVNSCRKFRTTCHECSSYQQESTMIALASMTRPVIRNYRGHVILRSSVTHSCALSVSNAMASSCASASRSSTTGFDHDLEVVVKLLAVSLDCRQALRFLARSSRLLQCASQHHSHAGRAGDLLLDHLADELFQFFARHVANAFHRRYPVSADGLIVAQAESVLSGPDPLSRNASPVPGPRQCRWPGEPGGDGHAAGPARA